MARSNIFWPSNKTFTRLILVVLLLNCGAFQESHAAQQCKSINPVSKFVQHFDCPPNRPFCCDDNTVGAHCCEQSKNGLLSMSLTVLSVFSIVFAAMLCAGCGGKKEEGPPATGEGAAAQTPSQIAADQQQATEQTSAIEPKKSAMETKSNIGSKIRSKVDGGPGVSTAEMASAISALDSKAPASSAGSTIESKTSNIASRISGTGSSIGSKVGSSALDSRASAASSTASSLDSKASSMVGSTVGQSNIGSTASRSTAGSNMGSRIESRASSVAASKSGFTSNTGSALDSKVSGTGSTITSKASRS